MNSKKPFISLFIAILVFTACDPVEKPEEMHINKGAYVLNQGSFKKNNAGITYYDFATGFASNDIFLDKNNRSLGDTGQDMIAYGSKLYVAMYSSKVVEVLDKKTAKSIKTITITNNNATSAPRALAAAMGKVYVTLYDGYVAQIDTVTLNVEKSVKVGSNPEGIAITNNKIFVANSGGMQAIMDSTISVINMATFTEIKKIKVNLNPGVIQADSYGDLYVLTKGNYFNIPAQLQHINTATDKVTDIDMKAQYMDIVGDKAYVVNFEYAPDWSVTNKTVGIYDVKNEKIISNNILKSEIAKTPFSINVDPSTNLIYVGETDFVTNGKMYCFDENGTLKYSFTTGVNPAKVLFVK